MTDNVKGPVSVPASENISMVAHLRIVSAQANRTTELEVAASEMRRERDNAKAEARQWKADCRKAQADLIDERAGALREAWDRVESVILDFEFGDGTDQEAMLERVERVLIDKETTT